MYDYGDICGQVSVEVEENGRVDIWGGEQGKVLDFLSTVFGIGIERIVGGQPVCVTWESI